MVTPPERRSGELDALFVSPDDPGSDAPVPLIPNARIRARRGYTPDPVEEVVPTPVQDPRVTFLAQRSAALGEVQFPADEVIRSVSMVPSHTIPEWLGADALQKYEERIRAREGSRIKNALWFWTLLSFALGLITLIASLFSGGLRAFGYDAPTALFLFTFGFAMGVLINRIVQYGWLPWCRLIFLSSSRRTDIVQWRKGYGAADRLELQRRVDKR